MVRTNPQEKSAKFNIDKICILAAINLLRALETLPAILGWLWLCAFVYWNACITESTYPLWFLEDSEPAWWVWKMLAKWFWWYIPISLFVVRFFKYILFQMVPFFSRGSIQRRTAYCENCGRPDMTRAHFMQKWKSHIDENGINISVDGWFTSR